MMSSSAGGWSVNKSKSRFAPTSQINVTPFVDVMLVLLIVFMVATPLLTVTIPVDLAKSDANPTTDAKPLMVTVTNDGTIFVGEQQVPREMVAATIQALAGSNHDQRIYVSGDKNVPYQAVMEIMGVIDSAGFSHIGLMGTSATAPAQ